MILCQSCLNRITDRFEEDRQLCHKCKVQAEAEWDEAFNKKNMESLG